LIDESWPAFIAVLVVMASHAVRLAANWVLWLPLALPAALRCDHHRWKIAVIRHTALVPSLCRQLETR
jgi:hypothetical protein